MVALWIAIGLVVLVALFVVYAYNRIVVLEMRVNQAWADVDVQLKRVAELIPNLVNTLKGSARFERSTLEAIADAHTRLMEAMRGTDVGKKVESASRFMGVLVPIIYQIPQYPDLKTTKAFRKMMDELTESIDKIAYARQFYNQAVADYNTFISLFPWNVVAGVLGKTPKPFFEVPEREEIMGRLESGELTEGLEKL